jgi:hypothetical protein
MLYAMAMYLGTLLHQKLQVRIRSATEETNLLFVSQHYVTALWFLTYSTRLLKKCQILLSSRSKACNV